MNYTVINGSYHKEGDTSILVDSLLKGIKESDSKANIELINLIDKEIGFCKGCMQCVKNDGNDLGRCVQNDGVEKILRSMLDCDRLVFASPIYEMDMTARLKRFNERSMPILYRSKGFPKLRNKPSKGKKGIIIMSSGMSYPLNKIIGATTHPAKILNYFLKAFKCKNTKALHAGGIRASRKAREKFLKKAYKLGLEFGN